MKYMITFNHMDGVWGKLSREEQEQHGKWLVELGNSLKEIGSQLVFFRPHQEAKTIRMTDDRELRVTDGLRDSSSEQPGGYYIVDVGSEEEAIEWARKGRFMVGSNEIRQIADFEI
jgi:hypothetical protein